MKSQGSGHRAAPARGCYRSLKDQCCWSERTVTGDVSLGVGGRKAALGLRSLRGNQGLLSKRDGCRAW